jgi:hypothetical protein
MASMMATLLANNPNGFKGMVRLYHDLKPKQMKLADIRPKGFSKASPTKKLDFNTAGLPKPVLAQVVEVNSKLSVPVIVSEPVHKGSKRMHEVVKFQTQHIVSQGLVH